MSPLRGALLVALLISTVLGWVHVLGTRVAWIAGGGVVLALLVACVVWFGMRRAADVQAWMRERFWAADAGQHHAFDGVMLRIEDDGRHVWIDGPGLQRVLRRREPEDAQAARHSGAWRRSEQGVLMLRVDAVVQQLARMPGRDEPRIQKLRRYLERDVLYPAARRRAAPR
ncbi:MAG: hypothetical protein KA141_06915 [Rubrivivax sp.]|nr:hypothetical protein [Rubrivivax sp.]